MKDKLLFIVFVLLLNSILHSCGSSRKVQMTTSVTEVENVTKSSDSKSVVQKNLITAADSANEELHIIITEYDTSKPVDTVTGKHPVQKEVKATRKQYSKKSSEQQNIEKLKANTETCTELQIEDDKTIENTKEREEPKLPGQIVNLVWAICFLFVILIIWKYVRK